MRMSRGKNKLMQIGLFVGLLAFSLAPAQVFAANDDGDITESIVLSPVSKKYDLKAGSTTEDVFKVVNDGKVAYDFIVYARPYSVNDESYQPDFISKAQNADAYKWVQFEQPSYKVEPGATVEVKYTVRVPENATPGGHYGVLFAETQPSENSSNGNVVKRTKRVGGILYATVQGSVFTGGKIENVDVPFFQNIAPLKTNTRVSNSGNTDFIAKTTIKAFDLFGTQKFATTREYPVLPSTTRKAAVEWPSPAWLGVYKIELTTSFLDTNKSSTHYVLMVPLWVYLTLGLLIGARVAYALSRRKNK